MILLIQPFAAGWNRWEALATRENLGYEVLELSMPDALEDVELRKERISQYQQSGRVRALHGVFIDVNPASGDPLFRQLSRQRSRESCVTARALGASWIVFHASCFPFLRGGYLDRWAAESAEFYTALAEEFETTVCIENSPDLDPEPMYKLLKRSGNRVRVCLDFGHANYSRAPLEKWFDVLGEYIHCFHLSDNMGQFDDHLPLGKGTVDWALADRLWKQLGRETPMTLEVGGLEGVEFSLDFLRGGYFGIGAET